MQNAYKSILLELIVFTINHNKIIDKNKRNFYFILFYFRLKRMKYEITF